MSCSPEMEACMRRRREELARKLREVGMPRAAIRALERAALKPPLTKLVRVPHRGSRSKYTP